MDVEE
ncbi:Protein of unknown function [Lactobacillus helveticus CIRM-BIA 953]